MQKILIVVDMQNDFISGALGTKEAEAIVDKVKNKIEAFSGKIIFTRDTHQNDYLTTNEGKHLPVPHCIQGTQGWEIHPALSCLSCDAIIDKPTFGSLDLVDMMQKENQAEPIETITLVGLCTDICVISNAMLLKAAFPEVPITVYSSCSAGVTVESHNTALNAMKAVQIEII